MKCFVSGATGFVGRQLCQRLAVRGDTVVGISKSGAALNERVDTHAVDLADSDPDAALLRDVDVVFHLAGIAHQRAAPNVYQRVNVDATLRLAHLASRAGVRCFIFLSSVRAMGAPVSLGARAEADCDFPTDSYGQSKLQAERQLQETFSDDSMAVVILRPPLVYGAGVKGNLRRLAHGAQRGMPRPPSLGCRSLVALDDLVELLCVVADKPPKGVRVWLACGDQNYSARMIYDLLRPDKSTKRSLPVWLWRLAASMLDLVVGDKGSSFQKLFGTEIYSNAAVKAATGWQPRVTLDAVVHTLRVQA